VHGDQAYPNLIWDISKEALGYGHTDVNYITSRIEHLRELDQFEHLVTAHDYGSFSQPEEQEITQWPSFAKPEGNGFRVLIVNVLK